MVYNRYYTMKDDHAALGREPTTSPTCAAPPMYARGSSEPVPLILQGGGFIIETSRDASVQAAASINDDHRMGAGTVSGEQILC